MSGHLIDRPARVTKCPACNSHIFAAVIHGCSVTADLQPVDLGREIAVRITGLLTFAMRLQQLPRRIYLDYRDLAAIKAGRERPVLQEHGCRPHIPITDGIEFAKLRPAQPAQPKVVTDDQPPF